MHDALPTSWGNAGRGFWTRRRRSATSLVAVLALVAGIAVAYKLFDQRVPNNVVRDASVFDYGIYVARTTAQGCTAPRFGNTYCDTQGGPNGNPIFAATTGVGSTASLNDQFPGDTREEGVRIINENQAPARDASFQFHLDNITVAACVDSDGSGDASNGDFTSSGACVGGTVPVTGQPAADFISFFSMEVERQSYVNGLGQQTNNDLGFAVSCPDTPIDQITAAVPCELGTIRAAGTDGLRGEALDTRDYVFKVTEADVGDQSAYRGWTVTWEVVFNARVPAVADPDELVYES